MKQTLSIKDRDRFIRKVRRDHKAWIDPTHIIMRESVGKKEGYKLRRAELMNGILDTGLHDLDALLTKAVEGDKETEAVLCQIASIFLFKLAETSPPPLKWFPKELAMLASSKLEEIANNAPERHRGANSADFASRDHFIIKKVREACNELDINPTRNDETGYRDSGCSIVAKALENTLGLDEEAVKKVWNKRKQFGFA